MSRTGSGDGADFGESIMNLQCWRAILDNLSKPEDILAVAAASPTLTHLLEENDEIHGAQLCSRNKFDVVPKDCYNFTSETKTRDFLTFFEGHSRSPFVDPICTLHHLSSEVTLKLVSLYDPHLREVRLNFNFDNSIPLPRLIRYLPNVDKLSVKQVSWSFTTEPFALLPHLTQLKVTTHMNAASLYSSLVFAHGAQLTRLSLEISSFSYPELTVNEWNSLGKLCHLEIQSGSCNGFEEMLNVFSLVQWPQLREIRLPMEYLEATFSALQCFRASLETIGFDNRRQPNLQVWEDGLPTTLANHSIYEDMVELSIVQETTLPASEVLRKYWARMFPNLQRLIIMKGDLDVQRKYEHLQFYFEDFPNLEEIRVETERGLFTVYKRRRGAATTGIGLMFSEERSMEVLLNSLREKLERLSYIQKLTVILPRDRTRVWVRQPVNPVVLPEVPHLTKLDLSCVDLEEWRDRRSLPFLVKPLVGSLFTSFGYQLTHLDINQDAFYAGVGLPTWNRLANLEILRVKCVEHMDWRYLFEILSRTRWPQIRELYFEEWEIPFDLQILMILKNFRSSLQTLQIFGWSWPMPRGPLVWIGDEEGQDYGLPIVTKLIVSQLSAGNRNQAEVWRSFSRLLPNMRKLHFLKSYQGRTPLGVVLRVEDCRYYSELFGTVNEIRLVTSYGKPLDSWTPRH